MRGVRKYRHKKQKTESGKQVGDLKPKAAILRQRQKRRALDQRKKKNQSRVGLNKSPQQGTGKKSHQQRTGKRFSKR